MTDRPLPLPDVGGWSVSGRNGHLGHVVSPLESERSHQDDSEFERSEDRLLVRGGTTQALYFHVPVDLVSAVASSRCDLRIDADVSDFTAHLQPDGSVDLFPRRGLVNA